MEAEALLNALTLMPAEIEHEKFGNTLADVESIA